MKLSKEQLIARYNNGVLAGHPMYKSAAELRAYYSIHTVEGKLVSLTS